MPRRKQPKPEIIEYKQLKTAAGGGGRGGGGGFRPGDNIVCKIIKGEPGGYSVVISNYNLPGFLPTQAILRAGEEILAQFVCVHNHRIIVSARFSNNSPKVQAHASVRWEEHLDEIDQRTETDADEELEPPHKVQQPMLPTAAYSSGGPLFSITSHHAISHAGPTEAEAATGVWAATTPRTFHFKRATDLILLPLDRASLIDVKIGDYDLEWLITDLEGGMRTGCVRASCESKLSRSAMLLYRGRAVGCIYGCKSMPNTQPTEQSLQNMLSDLEVPDTDVQIYDLPENVTLAMSALFLGYPVQRNDNYDARAYMDYISGWFESKGNTACLAITLPSNAATCLAFIYKGKFCGAFYVEDQQFRTDKEFIYELLRNDPEANVEASILPPEMTSSAVRFGFSLSIAGKRLDTTLAQNAQRSWNSSALDVADKIDVNCRIIDFFDDFTPNTDLERAFAQASGWDIDRLWKEADRSGDREDWNRFFGQSSCLSYQLAAAGQQPHLNTVTTAMVACIDHLTSAQQRSLFKVSTYVVNRLLDQDVPLESIETRLVLRVMCSA